MGCGASNDAVTQTRPVSDVAIVPKIPPVPQKQREEIIKPPVIAQMSADTMNVLITCHNSQQNIAEQLRKDLNNKNFTCYIVNETTPQSIIARANLIRWCDVFIVIISRMYQQTFFCMETINYAKDLRKPIIAILAESDFQPYGALGAISASAVRSIVLGNDGVSEKVVAQVFNIISTQKNKKKNVKNVVDSATIENDDNSVNLIHGENASTILICTANDGVTVGQLIYDEFISKNFSVAFENLSKPNAVCSVRQCTVFVPILSPELEQTPVCRAAFEEARRCRKSIVPVMAIRNWKPEDWISLTIGGSTFFQIFDKESAYKPFYDSNRMTDLCVEVEIACRPAPSQAEREQTEMKAIKEKIEECKSKLKTWPPARKPRTINPMGDREPVRVTLEEPSAKLAFTHIHHSITRMDIKAPPSLLDEYGLPKRREIDCMISYQWDNQDMVRKVYEDMLMREVPTWFDIWGSMHGNTNNAVAIGVECSKVLLVFFSKAYVESANCQLEFRYAVKRGKAFVVIRTEPNIPMEQWMMEAIQGFPQYDIFSYDSLEQLVNGVPTIDVIVQAVRKLAQAQPRDIVDDCSAELYELRSLLDDARDALSAEVGESRYKTCTRCNQQFDEYTKGGCKQHRAYYMGGDIVEGQWVCCRQQAKDSPGCEPCDHTDAARVFTQDPSFGTWTWEPN